MTVDFCIPELETDRLRLRLPRLEDLPAHAEFRASECSKDVGGPFGHTDVFVHPKLGSLNIWVHPRPTGDRS